MKKTRDYLDVIRAKMAENPELAAAIEREDLNTHVAQIVYDARVNAGLTQSQLANLIGTQQSVVSRLEDSDYSGRTIDMLFRIAHHLNMNLKIDFEPKDEFEIACEHTFSFAHGFEWVNVKPTHTTFQDADRECATAHDEMKLIA